MWENEIILKLPIEYLTAFAMYKELENINAK